ncbi:MAG: hypothetical protein GKR90_01650 [Pseudomonadales bacterium]|nr:hypothetical protein [Pseudomonadales bacterium]
MPQVTRRLFLIVALALTSSSIWAADPDIYATKKGAIRGTDVVAYFDLAPGDRAIRGRDEFAYEWQGAVWKFTSGENRERFIAEPEKYAPQYGGYCAFAVSHNFTKTVKPDVWEIVDGKLYLNFNRTAYRKWKKDVTSSIERGDANWPTVLQSCEQHNNCRKAS